MHEKISHLIVDRSETLQLTRRLEATHHFLADPCRLVRVFRPVVQPLVLAMFDVQPQIVVRRRVAPELVGNQDTRSATMFSEQFSHEPSGRMTVPSALHQHVEYSHTA